MSDIISIGVVIDGARTKKDGTISFTFSTNEIPQEQMADIFSLVNKFAYVLVKEAPFAPHEEDEIAELLATMPTQKEPVSKSRILRNKLFGLFKVLEDEGIVTDSFEDYYARMMDKWITSVTGIASEIRAGTTTNISKVT